jgi:hypothetical protein
MATKKQKEDAKKRALSIAKAASKSVKENQAAMRRATAREGLLAEAGVPFPHLTIHKRVAAGKTSRETPAERKTRATKTAGATSMAIAKAGGIKKWNEKIDERVKENEKKEEKKEEKKKETKKKVITKKKIVPKKKVIAKKKEVSTKERVKLTPKMTGGSEYLATDYDRPGFQDWSDLEPPNMPGLLGSAKAQQDLLGSGMAAYQPWAQPAIEYQPPVGPTYATRASLLGSSPAEVAEAVANNQRNNQQLNNPLATDPNAWVGPGGQTDFMQFTKDNAQGYYPDRFQAAQDAGFSGLNYWAPGAADWRASLVNGQVPQAAPAGTREVFGQGNYNFPAPTNIFQPPFQPAHALDQMEYANNVAQGLLVGPR